MHKQRLILLVRRQFLSLGAAMFNFAVCFLSILLMVSGSQISAAGNASPSVTSNDFAARVNYSGNPQRKFRRPQSRQFSNFVLTTQHGKRVHFYDDLIKDKAVMINFMYTTCPKICPANSARLAQIHDRLKKWMGRDLNLLSLSIDPQVDTPERLKAYWKVFGSKPGWTFLTGRYEEIERLRRELGVYDLDPVIDADKTQHSGILTFGNDRTDRWLALPVLMHSGQLAKTVLQTTWDDHWTPQNRRKAKPKHSITQDYKAQGVVQNVNTGKGTIIVAHGNIPGLMPAMTMDFAVREPALLVGIQTGARIAFELEHDGRNYVIHSLQEIGH